MHKTSGSTVVAITIGVALLLVIGGAYLVSRTTNQSKISDSTTASSSTATGTSTANAVPPGLSMVELKNYSYLYPEETNPPAGSAPVAFISSNPIAKFTNGSTAIENDKGTRSWSTLDTDHVAYGDLNSDGIPDAAIIIVNTLDASAGGGTGGADMFLTIVSKFYGNQQEGTVIVLANENIGSLRWLTVQSISISEEVVTVTAKDERLNQQTTLRFRLKGNQLVAA